MQNAAAASLAEQKKIAADIRRDSRLALAMQDGDGVDEHVFKRGSYKTPGDEVPRRFLEALAGPEAADGRARQRPAGAGPANDRPGRSIRSCRA